MVDINSYPDGLLIIDFTSTMFFQEMIMLDNDTDRDTLQTLVESQNNVLLLQFLVEKLGWSIFNFKV